MSCLVNRSSLDFLCTGSQKADFLLRVHEVEQLRRIVEGCGQPSSISPDLVQMIVDILTRVVESEDPKRAIVEWDRFFRTKPSVADLRQRLQQKNAGHDDSSSGAAGAADVWWLLSGLTPYVPSRARVASSFVWKMAILGVEHYKKNEFYLGLCSTILTTAFPSLAATRVMRMVGYANDILHVIAHRRVRGLPSLLRKIVVSPPSKQRHDWQEMRGIVVSSSPSPKQQQHDWQKVRSAFFGRASNPVTTTTRTEPTIMPRSLLASKHATLLTKAGRLSRRSLEHQVEDMITTHPLLRDSTQYVPLALALFYGLKKAIVIDRYETLSRAITNYTRRALGEKIRPTKNTPYELILSGTVRPIVRRDLLVSNLLLLVAFFRDSIERVVCDL